MSVTMAVDNGVTGSVAILYNDIVKYHAMTIKRELNYTKKKAWINRIDTFKLSTLFASLAGLSGIICAVERPMVNPARFKASMSAIRALEAVQIVLDNIRMPYSFIDSKEWQKVMLPSGLKGPELKTASDCVAKRLFPNIKFKKNGGGDSLLIAEYLRRTRL